MITKEQIISILDQREESIQNQLGVHCVNYGNVADAILKILATQSQPCQTGYSRATVENALQRGVNIAMENLEWDGENHPTFDNITMVNKCNEYLSSLTNKPTE